MVYAYTPTGSWLFLKPPQFVEEDTFGVPPEEPTFKLIGNTTDINPVPNVGKSVDMGLGKRDILSQTGLTEKYTAAFRWKPQTQLDFAKYGVNLANEGTPAGTNAASITIAWSKLVNGTEKYFALTGVRTDKVSIEISKDGGVMIGQDLKAVDFEFNQSDLSGIGIVTPTYVSTIPTTPTMTSKSGGLTPMSVDTGGGFTAREVNRFKTDVNQNVAELDLNGPPQVQYLQAAHRNIAIDFETPFRDSVFYDAYIAQTQIDIDYIIYNGVSPEIKLSMIDCQIDSWNQGSQGSSNAFEFEVVTATPNTISLTGGT